MNKQTKRFCAGMLSTITLFSLAGCGIQERDSDLTTQTTEQKITDTAVSVQDTADTEKAAETQETDHTQNPSEYDYKEIYDEVLMNTCLLLIDTYDHEMTAGETGIREIAAAMESADAPKRIGYVIQDISGDGIPELLIGSMTGNSDVTYGNSILAVYTCADGIPYLTFEGWSRNTYYYLGEGTFFNRGSSGAMYSQFGWFDIAPDGTKLNCKDFYFTYPADGEGSEIGFYSNQSGISDPEQAQALTISGDEFYQIEEAAANQAQELAMTSFYDYSASHVGCAKLSSDSVDGTPVHVQWWNGDVPAEDEYEQLIVDDDAYAAEVMFTTEYDVTDFKLMKLYLSDIYDDGTVVFYTVPVDSPDVLTQERPLLVHMTFPGDIPAYGISYKDPNGDGTTLRFAVAISGEDGSLLLIKME